MTPACIHNLSCKSTYIGFTENGQIKGQDVPEYGGVLEQISNPWRMREQIWHCAQPTRTWFSQCVVGVAYMARVWGVPALADPLY